MRHSPAALATNARAKAADRRFDVATGAITARYYRFDPQTQTYDWARATFEPTGAYRVVREAKPGAAAVGWPAPSKATALGGPMTSSVTSAWEVATSLATRARRRELACS